MSPQCIQKPKETSLQLSVTVHFYRQRSHALHTHKNTPLQPPPELTRRAPHTVPSKTQGRGRGSRKATHVSARRIVLFLIVLIITLGSMPLSFITAYAIDQTTTSKASAREVVPVQVCLNKDNPSNNESDEGNSNKVAMSNEGNNPETGDNSIWLLFLAGVLVTAALGLGLVSYERRKAGRQ